MLKPASSSTDANSIRGPCCAMTSECFRNFCASSQPATPEPERMLSIPTVPQQETNRNQVEKYAERPRNSVVRIAPLTVHVANGHFYNRSPVPGSQGRNEAVQLPIQRNLFKNVSPIRFKGRAKIVNVYAA